GFLEIKLGAVDGVKTDRLFAGQLLFLDENAVVLRCLARERDPHAEPWVVRIPRGQRIQTRRVTAAGANRQVRLKPTLVSLEMRQAFFAKGFQKHRAVEIKAVWLQ